MPKDYKIALVGNPNSGKSTLFNELTGLNQKIGNFPGVTVDKKTGIAQFNSKSGEALTQLIIDLPGTYSLQPKSSDEQVAVDVLKDKSNELHPDLIVVVVDASNIKRNLYLVTQLIELEIPVIVALNMIDIAPDIGQHSDAIADQLGVQVVPISARQKIGLEALREAMATRPAPNFHKFIEKHENPAVESIARNNAVSKILREVLKKDIPLDPPPTTVKLDAILTHRIWGYVAFLLVLFLIFQSIFFLASFPMQWIESFFGLINQWSKDHLPAGELTSLWTNGILAGLGGVLVFIPQIALLFGFIAILEDTGYMSRVSFIMDKLMRKFGLNGRSVIPLISGVACAVPAIMGTRTISNWKERMITILVTPLVSCSARLPVYTLLISLIFPHEAAGQFFSMKGLMLMLMYLIGFGAALTAALVINKVVKSTETSYFIMEMPIYRSPRWKNLAFTIYEKIKVFVFDVGKVIVAISIILWALSSHGPSGKFDAIEKKFAQDTSATKDQKIAAEKLQASFSGMLGKAIEPAIAPLGFDWKIGIALISSFAAREVFVGTMATIYSVESNNSGQSIREKMMNEINPRTGKLQYSKAVGLSLLLFFAFAMQCMSTLAVVKRETNSWKWPIIQFAYMGVLAYGVSFLVFHFFS